MVANDNDGGAATTTQDEDEEDEDHQDEDEEDQDEDDEDDSSGYGCEVDHAANKDNDAEEEEEENEEDHNEDEEAEEDDSDRGGGEPRGGLAVFVTLVPSTRRGSSCLTYFDVKKGPTGLGSQGARVDCWRAFIACRCCPERRKSPCDSQVQSATRFQPLL